VDYVQSNNAVKNQAIKVKENRLITRYMLRQRKGWDHTWTSCFYNILVWKTLTSRFTFSKKVSLFSGKTVAMWHLTFPLLKRYFQFTWWPLEVGIWIIWVLSREEILWH